MINLDFLTLKAFFLENIDFIIGARLQKIQQPTRKDFIFSLRNNSESRKLYINITPALYHISFMSKENELRRGIIIPKQPPMFCMLLRKYLEGSKISDACVIENERILEFHFETCDEFAQRKSLCLAFEFMGKHSNAILYDRETFIIIGCAHNVGSEKSRYRELKGGLKYIYPPKKDKIILSNELMSQFSELNKDKIDEYLRVETFRPAICDGKYTLFSELLENSVSQNSVNEMLDNYYSSFQEKINIQNVKNKIFDAVNSKLKKNQNAISKIEAVLHKRQDYEKYKLYGDLLLSNLYAAVDYQSQTILFDYNSGKNITIELDSTKTVKENAQRYFKLYSKHKNTKEKSTELLNKLCEEKDYLEHVLYSTEKAQNISDLLEIEAELGLCEELPKKKSRTEIQKVVLNGFDVYIGKNNHQNDYIISKIAKEEDYWFHTRLCAGSHVLLKINNTEPDEKTLYECAKLAREYSSAKQPSKVGVIYTKRKNLKKPPSAPLGYVTYKNEKEIYI